MTQRVYICPEDCRVFLGEDGCKRQDTDTTAVYEKEGDYPVCPFYMKDLLADKGMTLEEAIETLELNCKGREALGIEVFCLSLLKAQRLGIEALLREQRKRKAVSLHRDDLFVLLPGETKGVTNGL